MRLDPARLLSQACAKQRETDTVLTAVILAGVLPMPAPTRVHFTPDPYPGSRKHTRSYLSMLTNRELIALAKDHYQQAHVHADQPAPDLRDLCRTLADRLAATSQ